MAGNAESRGIAIDARPSGVSRRVRSPGGQRCDDQRGRAMNEAPDPLDDFLEKPPGLPMDATRKDALLRRTVALLPPRRRRAWPIAIGVAAAACIAVLVTTYILVRSNWIAPDDKNVVERKEPAPHVLPAPPEIELVRAPVTPFDLEWSAFDAD